MIAAWMTYALVVALLVSCAALSAERIALLRRVQSRWIWVAAMMLTLVLPLLLAWHGARTSARPAKALAALAARDELPLYELTPIAWVSGGAPVVARRVALDTWLLTGWSAMSTLALVTLTVSPVIAVIVFFWAMFVAAGFIVVGLRSGARMYPPGYTSLVAGMAAGSWSALSALILPFLGRWFDQHRYTTTFVVVSLIPVVGTFSWWVLSSLFAVEKVSAEPAR